MPKTPNMKDTFQQAKKLELYQDIRTKNPAAFKKYVEGLAMDCQDEFYEGKDGMSESQEYTYEADPQGVTTVFTLRKNGRYYPKGDPMGSTPVLSLGVRREYYDYSF